MAKKKARPKAPAAERCSFLDDVRAQVPSLYEQAASLQPFNDVITDQWCDRDERCVGIGFDIDGRVCPSGVYSLYGARLYDARVVLFHDMYMDDGSCVREQYESDLPRLWSLLRQIPRPVHSFGVWTEALNGGE
jgi:hypothetical protein